MNLELYSIQFRNPETQEIITVTLEDYFVKNEKGALFTKNSEEYIQASLRTGFLLAGGLPKLKYFVPNAKVYGDSDTFMKSEVFDMDKALKGGDV